MTRTERRQLERQQAKSQRKNQDTISFSVATTLSEALTSATMHGATSFQFEDKVYFKTIDDTWKEYDILPQLFTLPLYRNLYNEMFSKAEVDTDRERDDFAKQFILLVFTSELGSGSEYDVNRILN